MPTIPPAPTKLIDVDERENLSLVAIVGLMFGILGVMVILNDLLDSGYGHSNTVAYFLWGIGLLITIAAVVLESMKLSKKT